MELTYSSQESDELYRGRRRATNTGGESTTFRQETLRATWRALDTLDVDLVVPRIEIHNEGRGRRDIDLEGLGDLSLSAIWGPWRRPPAVDDPEDLFDIRGVSFLAGLKFPTGEEGDRPAPGATPPSLLQLGTGTYDPLVGVLYRGRAGELTLFHSTSAQVSGGASKVGLRSGNVLQTATGIEYEISSRIRPRLALEGMFRDKDVLNGSRIDNTGSSLWFVTPGVQVRLTDRVFLDASIRIPVYRNVDRTQLVPGSLWTVGLSWSL